MATTILPKLLANFSTSLAATMSSSATSCTLNVSTDGDGSTLSGLYQVTFDEGTSSEEHMYVTFAGSAGTVSRRGLSKVDAWTEVSGNKYRHDRGASVKITNFSLILINRLLLGTDTFNAADWLGVNSISGLATPTAGETSKAANIAYVNAVAIAGASDASTTTKGIVEEATQAEVNAGTDTGATGARLFVTPSKLAAVIQVGTLFGATDSVGTDSYAITLVPALTAYATNQLFVVKFGTANTGAATLNVNGLGAKTIKKLTDQDLETNDIEAGTIGLVAYDGTNMQLLSVQASMPTTAILAEMSTFFTNTDITGAEAETLSSASTSAADTLHTHTKIPTGHNLIVLAPTPDAGNPARGCGYSQEGTIEYITIGNDDGLRTAFRVAKEFGVSLYPINGPAVVASIASCANTLYADGHTWAAAAAGGTTANQDGSGVTFASQACSGAMSWDDGNSYLLFHNTSTNVRRFTYSGTTLTFVDNITLGSACDVDLGWVFDDTNNMLYFLDTTDNLIRKFNASGVLQTSTAYASIDDTYAIGIVAMDGRIYIALRSGNGESSATASLDMSMCCAMLVPTSVTF